MRSGKKYSLLFSALLALISFSAAAPAFAEDRFTEAAKLFEAGQFEKARQAYLGLLSQPELPPSYYFNAGTASYRAGAVGEAYVLLSRAAAGDPWDGDIRQNLSLASQKIPVGVKSVRPASWLSWWPGELHVIPWPVWLLASLLILLPFLWPLRNGALPTPSHWALLAGASMLLLCALSAGWQARIPVGGILATSQITSGPAKTFPNISALEAGALVNVEESREGWSKLRYIDSRLQETVGWVESAMVLKF